MFSAGVSIYFVVFGMKSRIFKIHFRLMLMAFYSGCQVLGCVVSTGFTSERGCALQALSGDEKASQWRFRLNKNSG
jgi:hypothetical protein